MYQLLDVGLYTTDGFFDVLHYLFENDDKRLYFFVFILLFSYHKNKVFFLCPMRLFP